MKFDDFYPLILPEVPGCPDITVQKALVMAAIDFCRETLAWTEVQDALPLVNNVQDYEIDVPSGAYLVTVRDVWIGSRRLQPKGLSDMYTALPDWQTAATNMPMFYNQAVDRGSLRLYPMPGNITTEALVVRAAYAPLVSATSIPDFIGQRHMDVLCSGAKARLLLMSTAVWANQAAGMYHKQIFDDGVIKSRIEEAHDRVRGSISVSPRRFGF